MKLTLDILKKEGSLVKEGSIKVWDVDYDYMLFKHHDNPTWFIDEKINRLYWAISKDAKSFDDLTGQIEEKAVQAIKSMIRSGSLPSHEKES